MAKVILRADSVTVESNDYDPPTRDGQKTKVTVAHMGDRYELVGRLGTIRHIPPPTQRVSLRKRLSRAWSELMTTEERVDAA